MNIPARFEHAHVGLLTQEVRSAIGSWKNQRNNPRGKNCLMLYGKVGVGKTFAMWAMIKNANGAKYRITNSAKLVEEIRASFGQSENKGVLRSYMEYTGMLFIDDFGAERLTDFAQEVFYQIINSRYENKWPMVISTNYSLGEIAERLGDRVASRLAEMCYIIQITGSDRRFNK